MENIDTPAIIIDMKKVSDNLKKYQEYASTNGCEFRPHIKTHKIARLAKLQIEYGACGISCAKLGEAEVMAENGIKDIFIAYPIVGKKKIERLLKLSRNNRIICGVDSLIGAQQLSELAVAHGQTIEIRIEIDTGFKRTGVQLDDILDFSKKVHAMEGLSLSGIFTFKSSTLNGNATLDLKEAGREEGDLLFQTAEIMRKNGIPIKDVSGGSTPTGPYVAACEGVTELRAGTYVFQDVPKIHQHVADESECCAVVKVTVVSTPTPNRAVIDGGVKIFSGDTKIGAAPLFLEGYGKIIGHEHLVFDHMNEEHGVLISRENPTGLTVGDELYIIPNHICTSMNLCNFVFLKEVDGTYTKTKVDCRGLFN